MLKINGLTKNFKKVKAIDNFSFEFKNGVYGLLGPNVLRYKLKAISTT